MSEGREGLSDERWPLKEGDREVVAGLRFPEATEAISDWAGEGRSGGHIVRRQGAGDVTLNAW